MPFNTLIVFWNMEITFILQNHFYCTLSFNQNIFKDMIFCINPQMISLKGIGYHNKNICVNDYQNYCKGTQIFGKEKVFISRVAKCLNSDIALLQY